MNVPVNGRPYDFAISEEGRFAMVRTVGLATSTSPNPNGWVYIWDMLNVAAPQLIVNAQVQPGNREGCDAAFLLSERGLALASNATYGLGDPLRIWDLASSPTVSVLQSNNGLDSAWDASVRIAGSQLLPMAAVRHAFAGVSIWSLKTGAQQGTVSLLPNFNTLGACVAGANAGDARGLSDAVALTQQRVVAIANVAFPHALIQPVSLPVHGAVGIDVVDGTGIGLPASDLPRDCGASLDFVHDLAVSPNETLCAVSGRRFFAIYELATGTRTDLRGGDPYPTPNFLYRPAMSIATMDSVEMTDDRVVMIGNDQPWTNGFAPAIPPTAAADTAQCRVTLARIRSNGLIVEDRTWTGAQLFPNTLALSTRACDVAISPRGRWAVVHTRAGIAIFDLTAPVLAALTPIPLPAADPLNFPAGTANLPGEVVSDTVVCTDTTAVAIGRRLGQVPPIGFIDVINLVAPGGPVMTSIGLDNNILPTDVVLTPDGTKAIVRAQNPTQADGAASAGQIYVVDLTTLALTLIAVPAGDTFGKCRGADHVECNDKWAITGGDAGGTSGQVQFVSH